MSEGYKIRDDVEIEHQIIGKWQRILDLLSETLSIPVALIMRVHSDRIEVFAKNSSPDNDFYVGETAWLKTGLYCEAVMDTRREFIVSNALIDEDWKNNPDASKGLIAYMGFPIIWSTGEVFGTICVLDRKETHFSDLHKRLLGQFAQVVQDDLAAAIVRQKLESEINQHTAAEARLWESQERLRKYFNSITPSIISSLKDGTIIAVNESYIELIGYTHDELIGMDAKKLYQYPEEREPIIQKLRNHESVKHHELSLKAKSGDIKFVEVSVEIIDVDGQPCLLSTLHDITSYKNTQLEFGKMNERYALAIRAAQAGIWDWNITRNVLIWDDQMFRLYDIPKDSFEGSYETWISCVHPDDVIKCNLEMEQALTGAKEYNIEFRICQSDGQIRHIRGYGDLIRDDKGSPARMVGINFDITNIRELENKIISSEKLYRDLFNENSAICLVLDVETGSIFDVNTAALEYYGYPKDHLVGKSVSVLNGMHKNDILTNLNNAFSKKTSYYQVRHMLADGSLRDVEVFSGPIIIQDKKYINCIIHDITQRKEIEERLITSESRYRNLFHNNYAVQLIIDTETGEIFDANYAACTFYGHPLAELKQKKLWELNPGGRSFVLEKLRGTFQKGSDFIETKHRRWDGEIRDVEVFSGRIELENRKLAYAIVHDVSERKQAQNELVESERRFRLFFENAPDSIFVQTDFKIAYANPRTLELFGVKDESELIGAYVPDLFSAEFNGAVKERINQLNTFKQAVPLKEEAIIRRDGTTVDVEVSAVPFNFNGSDGALVYMRDITERKEFEKHRIDMEMQLRQKQKLESIGTLAGGVAHEINNPINGIINYAELISDDPSVSDHIRTYSTGITHEGRRIAEIVKNLLSFARQEKQTHSPAQISDIINQTISLIRTVMRHDQIALEINVPEGLPNIKCRSQQIQQVLMNLITNARDALNQRYKGFDEDKKIILNCVMFNKDGRRWFKITIEDHGNGIPKEILDRVFDPFFTTKPREEGTGLGLSISHGIVKDHHGELYFETEPGVFTRAVLILPVDNGWTL